MWAVPGGRARRLRTPGRGAQRGDQCPRVRCVNLTGSTKVGRTIGTLAAQHIKPAVLELGGKNSLVVLKDADLDYAASAAKFGAFMNAGQICMSVDRVLVDRSVSEEFTERFVEKVARAATGGHQLEHAVVPATVLTGVTGEMRVYDEEIYGAATTVQPVADADEAVRLANNTSTD